MNPDQIAMNTLYIALASGVAAILSCVANVVLALLTRSYVRLTREMVLEAKAVREPSVFFDVELPDNSVRLVIGNFGDLPARNVRLEVINNTTGIHLLDQADLSSCAPFRNTIPFLAPKRIYKYRVGYIYDIPEGSDQVLHVRVRYENEERRPFVHDTLINMSQFNGVLFESFHDPSAKIAEAINEAEQRRQVDKMFDFTSVPENRTTVPCPTCAEAVLPNAKKCKHCHEAIKHVDLAVSSKLPSDVQVP